MKKLNLLGLSAICLLGVSGLVGCNSTESNVINIQFVPSNDASTLAALSKRLEPVLEKICPDYQFKITTGTSYAATTEALLSDQVDVGFLTASGYAQATIQNPGKIEVKLTSVRKGYKVQVEDYKDDVENQSKAMNGEKYGYKHLVK